MVSAIDPVIIGELVSSTNRFMDIAYEVEICDVSLPSHRGCLTLLDLGQTDDVLALEQRADTYWSGTTVSKPELVTLSPIRILKKTQISPEGTQKV